MEIYSEICINGKVIKIDRSRSRKKKIDLEKFLCKNDNDNYDYGKIDMPGIWC